VSEPTNSAYRAKQRADDAARARLREHDRIVAERAFDRGVDAVVLAIFGPAEKPRSGIPPITWKMPANPYRMGARR
jgi:hypothetical protein